MLGRWRHCRGIRVVAGVGRRALRCRGRRATASGLKGMLQSTCCWVGRVAKRGVDVVGQRQGGGCGDRRREASSSLRRTTMGGIFPRCQRDCNLRGDAAIPYDGDAYNDEGGGLRDLEADGPPPPPSWLVCGFCLRERMNKKISDNQHVVGGTTSPSKHGNKTLCLKKIDTTIRVHSKAGNKTLSVQKWKQKSVSP